MMNSTMWILATATIPRAPKGFESNWIPTAGRRPAPTMRFYGPTDALMDKSFELPDFEVVGK